MFEILSYWFFQKALIAWILVSLVSGLLGTLVVLRREPNITHSISYMLFFGIIISFFFSWNYYIFWVLFAILWVWLIYFLERFSATSSESSKEIIAHIGLAGWIFWVWLLWNLQLDVFNFLFGNILFVQWIDIYLLAWMIFTWIILWFFFGKKIIRITLSREIARSQWIKVWIYEFWYLLYLALFIAFAIKIFGVLLLGAFLVLPGNIWKTLAQKFYHVFIIATIVSIVSVIIWLFVSYFFDTSAWASVVLILALMLAASIFIRKIFILK